MDLKNLHYINGHFYDGDTKQRLELREGAEIRIIAGNNDFISGTDVGLLPPEILTSEQKKREIERDDDIFKKKKICNSNTFLYFSISRTANEKPLVRHEFKIELLEDLYIIVKKSWKQQEGKLFECGCIVRQNTNNTIKFFEEINARSLNEAYKNTFVHYFGNKGNPACNALDRFYEASGHEELKISRYR